MGPAGGPQYRAISLGNGKPLIFLFPFLRSALLPSFPPFLLLPSDIPRYYFIAFGVQVAYSQVFPSISLSCNFALLLGIDLPCVFGIIYFLSIIMPSSSFAFDATFLASSYGFLAPPF